MKSVSSREFSQKVYEIVKEIPVGQTMTYQQVAKVAGSPKAYRAVGNILNKNNNPGIPCHRVIRTDRSIGGYNKGGETVKRNLLIKEGAL